MLVKTCTAVEKSKVQGISPRKVLHLENQRVIGQWNYDEFWIQINLLPIGVLICLFGCSCTSHDIETLIMDRVLDPYMLHPRELYRR